MKHDLVRIADRPDLIDQAARWFHEKWGIPEEAYRQSMRESLTRQGPVPQWYVLLLEDRGLGQNIVAGAGVIDNDFHARKDLRPNICALYVEEAWRRRGIAALLLQEICQDMHAFGIDTLYLVTEHTGLYERLGWQFLGMVQEDGPADAGEDAREGRLEEAEGAGTTQGPCVLRLYRHSF